MKTCKNKDCKQTNPQKLSSFTAAPRYKDGLYPLCKTCKKEYDARRYEANKAKILANSAKYYDNNTEVVQKRHAKWRKNNKEAVKEYEVAYRVLYPEKGRARCRKYQAAKLDRVPQWLTKEDVILIEEIYKQCPEGYEVDHMIPLQGKHISGLHVPFNLQYLPKSLNRSKSNKY